MRALRKLLDAGHSLIVIEHNLDVVRAADWMIDLGPEGGEGGGEIVCSGTPDDVKRHATSFTGKALADYERSARPGRASRSRRAGRCSSLVKRAARRAARRATSRSASSTRASTT